MLSHISLRMQLSSLARDAEPVASLRMQRTWRTFPMTDTDTSATADGEAAWDPAAWEEALIADLRANGGTPSDGPLKGHPIMVAYTTGAKSGERRRSILTYSRDGDAYVVAGTAGGSPTTPSWVANMAANPDPRDRAGRPHGPGPGGGDPRGPRARPPVGRACRAAAQLRGVSRAVGPTHPRHSPRRTRLRLVALSVRAGRRSASAGTRSPASRRGAAGSPAACPRGRHPDTAPAPRGERPDRAYGARLRPR